ncbi:MAG TPA: hypothetical protein VGQ72_05125 [Pyrinomonadaceae bacterium]|jgi:hypothetical protein|nr:hypothetical protein [Pyrinomonadaceae bacterium]
MSLFEWFGAEQAASLFYDWAGSLLVRCCHAAPEEKFQRVTQGVNLPP